MAKYQIFSALPEAVEAALRASIAKFGVIVPVVVDQHGQIIDGHHRTRIADELGVEYRTDRVEVADEHEAREMARTLNADRRHLTEQQRKEVVALLAAETVAVGHEEVARHSPNAIAGALGVDLRTVQRDMEELTHERKLTRPAKTLGQDGKVRPTRRAAAPEAEEGPRPSPKPYRMQLVKAFDQAVGALVKAVERVDRLTQDDRFPNNAKQVAHLVRHDLLRSLDLLAKATDRVPNPQKESTE